MIKFFQIQSWPTPEIFIKRGDSTPSVSEETRSILRLRTFTNATALPDSETENIGASLGLLSWNNGGPVENTVSENNSAAITLNSFVNPVIITATETEPVNSALTLNSFNNLPPVTRTEPDNVSASISLRSFVK